MKKIIATMALIVTLGLAGCNEQSPQLIAHQLKVVTPSEAMYYCPVLKKFPDFRTLTDRQVALLLKEAVKNNISCKSSLDSIKIFLEKSKRDIEQG